MKKLFLLSMLALPFAMLAKSPEPQYPAYDLPQGVTAVAPVQGFVSVSGSEYPSGVSNIGVDFSKSITVNPNNTVPAKLYKDDFSAPVATTLATSVDALTWRTGGVLFKDRKWNSTGVYKVEIPEGMWCYAETGVDGESVPGEPTPAITLMYEIYVGYTITPRPGLVDQLDVIYLEFPDADEVIPNAGAMGGGGDMIALSFYKDNSDANYELHYTVMDLNNDGRKNVVAFNIGDDAGIAQEFMEPGVFGLNIPGGSFTYITYGPNHDTDPEDCIERKSSPILVKYIIPNMPTPEVYPFPDVPQEKFTAFYLTPSDAFFNSWFVNDKIYSYLYRVNDEGVVDDSVPVAYLKARPGYWEKGNASLLNEVELYIYDRENDAEIESIKPAPGLYCLHVSESLLNGMSQYMEFLNGSPFEYFYEVAGSSDVKDVEAVSPESADVTVYNIAGVCVARNADKSVLSGLAKGLYIVNGKKVLVK